MDSPWPKMTHVGLSISVSSSLAPRTSPRRWERVMRGRGCCGLLRAPQQGGQAQAPWAFTKQPCCPCGTAATE